MEEKISFIAERSGLTRSDIQHLIEDKKREMDGLISDEGAAHLVAKDLGVDLSEVDEYKPVKLRIKDLKMDMRSVTITGRVSRVYPVREFERRGVRGKIASILLNDATGSVRVVLWGEHAELVENGSIGEGDIIRVVRGYIREGLKGEVEVHVGRGGGVELRPEGVDEEEYPIVERRTVKLSELTPEMRDVDVEVVVQRVYPATVFAREGGGEGRRKAMIIADDTGSVRAVFWDENALLVEDVKEGDRLKIENAYTKIGLQGDVELHVGKLAQVTVEHTAATVGRKVNIAVLEPDMAAVDVEGEVVEDASVKEFTRSDGTTGNMASLVIKDETGTVRVVAWGEQADMVADAEVGDTLKVRRGYTRIGLSGDVEVHVGRFSNVEVASTEDFSEEEEVKGGLTRKFLFQLEDGEEAEVRVTIRRLLRKKTVYEVCPFCGKVAVRDERWVCPGCGRIEPTLKLLVNAVVDDGTDTAEAVFTGVQAEKLLKVTPREAYMTVEKTGSVDAPIRDKAGEVEGKEVVLAVKHVVNPVTGRRRLKVISFREADPKEEAEHLLSQLEAMKKQA